MDFSVSYEESGRETAIFFILSPGVDPLKDVEKLGHKLGFSVEEENFHNISLGQGQESVAETALDIAAKNGHWIVLQVGCAPCACTYLFIMLSYTVKRNF